MHLRSGSTSGGRQTRGYAQRQLNARHGIEPHVKRTGTISLRFSAAMSYACDTQNMVRRAGYGSDIRSRDARSPGGSGTYRPLRSSLQNGDG